MKRIVTALLFLALSITSTCLLADNWPGGMTNIPGTSFALIYRDDNGRYIAQLPSDNTSEIQSTCRTGKPLWLYGSPKPGKCLAVMPERVADTGIIELQVTFNTAKDKQIVLLSVHNISDMSPALRGPDANELASLLDHIHDEKNFKENINRIKLTVLNNNKIIYFIPIEKTPNTGDDSENSSCMDFKTLVVMKNDDSFEKLGFLDNMPYKLIINENNFTPIVLTYGSCMTEASLWKIFPKFENAALFSNGVGD